MSSFCKLGAFNVIRWFFTHHCRSLRAMVSQFVFFIGIAAICFSGLLFTLWTLGEGFCVAWLHIAHRCEMPSGNDEPNATWTLKSIAWLLTQIWFGNSSLSFSTATSFHPLFGPILLIGFAALSNTLLLTSGCCICLRAKFTNYHLEFSFRYCPTPWLELIQWVISLSLSKFLIILPSQNATQEVSATFYFYVKCSFIFYSTYSNSQLLLWKG